MRRRTVAVLLLVAVAALATAAWIGALDLRPRFQLSLTGGESFSAIQVDLRDGSGLVTGLRAGELEPLEVPEFRGAIANLPGDPATLVLAWLGGACDDRMDLALERSAGGYTLGMHVDTGFSLGCNASAIARAVAIELSSPVDAGDVAIVWR